MNDPAALPADARTILSTVAGSPPPHLAVQCWPAGAHVSAALEGCGSSLDRLVKLTVFLADTADWPVFEAIRAAFVVHDLPAIECIAAPFPGPNERSAIQIDAVAYGG